MDTTELHLTEPIDEDPLLTLICSAAVGAFDDVTDDVFEAAMDRLPGEDGAGPASALRWAKL
jgi:hypothetical protein